MDGATGEVLWSKAYSSPEGLDESVYDIAVDDAGNAFVTGRQMNGAGGDDIMTMKLRASDGEILWRVHAGGAAMLDDRAWSIVVGPDNQPVLTGILTTPTDPADYRTMKLDTFDGSTVWSMTLPGAINNIAQDAGWLGVAGNGDILMVNKTWTTTTSYDVVIHRYAATTGDTVWTRRYNSSGATGDDPYAMAMGAAGDILVAGVRNGNYMILKFDADTGGLVWSTDYAGPAGGYDRAAAVIEGPAGEVIVTGFCTGSGTSWDVTTVARDGADGSPLWAMPFDAGGASADEGRALAVGPEGDIYVIGYGELLHSGSDLLALRYMPDTSTDVAIDPFGRGTPSSLLRFTASPNPFVSRVDLAIDMERAGPARLAVYDLRGRRAAVLHEGALPEGRNLFEWDGRDASGRSLATGVYFVRLESGGHEAVRKVILGR